MSTNSEPSKSNKGQPPPKNDKNEAALNSLIAVSGEPSATDISAAVLERALRHVSDQRKTERFFWIMAIFLLVDFLMAPNIGFGTGFGIYLLEIVMLIGLAHWLEVDFVKRPLQRIFDRYIK